jgi:hypothetical protein
MTYFNGTVLGDQSIHAVTYDDDGQLYALCWRSPVEAGRGRFEASRENACPDCSLRFKLSEERRER